MKKIALALSLILFISSVGFARKKDTPVSTSGVGVMKQGSTFTLYYKASQASNVKVSIYDATGALVYTEMIRKSDGFSRPYNFSKLSEGDYTISVQDGERVLVEKITYSESKSGNLVNISRVSGFDNKYLLTVPGKSSDVISVKIYDDKDQVLYDQKESLQGDFAKVYTVEGLTGNLLFSITDSKGNTTQKGY